MKENTKKYYNTTIHYKYYAISGVFVLAVQTNLRILTRVDVKRQ